MWSKAIDVLAMIGHGGAGSWGGRRSAGLENGKWLWVAKVCPHFPSWCKTCFWQHTDSKTRILFRSQLPSSSSSAFPSSTSTLSSSPSRTTISTIISSSITPTSTVVATLAKPANDCAAFGTPYIANVSTGKFDTQTALDAVFDIYCKTDYVKGDFTSFYAPLLLTCMNGCALFNDWQNFNGNLAKMNCSGVVYGLRLDVYGNCYLKSGGHLTTMTRDENSTYASLRSFLE